MSSCRPGALLSHICHGLISHHLVRGLLCRVCLLGRICHGSITVLCPIASCWCCATSLGAAAGGQGTGCGLLGSSRRCGRLLVGPRVALGWVSLLRPAFLLRRVSSR